MASPVLPVLRHNRELQSKSSEIHSTSHRSIRRRVHQKRAASYLSVDIVAKILVWLPVKIILRFKCVCKSWRKLISSDYFIDLHLELTKGRPPRLILCPYIRGAAVKVYSPSTEYTADLVFSELGSVRCFKSWPTVLPNACKGLNLLFFDDDIYVINVWTREFVRLPQGTRGFRTVVGLGFSSTSKKYKVVRFFHHWNGPGSCRYGFGCEVYTLGGGSGRWRKVCAPPYPVKQVYAFSNGAMHWVIDGKLCSCKPCPHAVVSFSVEDENFALVPLPPPSLDMENSAFFAAEGCLCVIYANFCREQRLDLWMLKDYHRGVWTRDYTIDLRNGLYRANYIPFTVYDGNILYTDQFTDEIQYFDAKTGSRKLAASIRRLSYYDPVERSMRNVVDWPPLLSHLSVCLHEESLVSLSDKR